MKEVKRFSWLIAIVILFGILVIWYFATRQNAEPIFDFVVVEKTSLAQSVSVTGRVKPSQSVELAFERGGRVDEVRYEVGDAVLRDEILIRLNSGELSAQYLAAQADVEAELAQLRELEKGTRPEEIEIAQNKVVNAEISVADAQTNFGNVISKAEADITQDYESAKNTLIDAGIVGKNAVLILSDLQNDYFNSDDEDSGIVTAAKSLAIFVFLGQSNAGEWQTSFISELSGGVFGEIQSTVNLPTREGIDEVLEKSISGLQSVYNSLSAVPFISTLSSTDKTLLQTEKTNVSTEISSLSSIQQQLEVQKITNAENISSAEEKINAAKSTLSNAQKELLLKLGGSTPEQISIQEARVKSAQARAQDVSAQLSKTLLRSPIEGVIVMQEAKVGEILSSNAIVVKINSASRSEIEANVPEIDIAKVELGDSAEVFLDAYEDEPFFANVSRIDPAEVVIEGVPTYKITLQFDKDDDRILSGMTADLEIFTEQKSDVLVIPQRSVIIRNGDKFVRVLTGPETFVERRVVTGLRGSDGRVEILDGVSEGERVITFFAE